MIRWFCKSIVGIFVKIFYRHKVYGKENFPKTGGMVVCNHSSFLDPPLVGISCPGIIHFLARESLFKSKAFAWLLGQLKTHPVRSGSGNLDTLKYAMELLKSGRKVVIFPEGSRSRDGSFQKGQLGVGMLVYRTECPVIPIYVHGTFDAWSPDQSRPKLIGKTACIIGKPLDFTHLATQDRKEAQNIIVTRLMQKIEELQAWYLAGHKGSPP